MLHLNDTFGAAPACVEREPLISYWSVRKSLVASEMLWCVIHSANHPSSISLTTFFVVVFFVSHWRRLRPIMSSAVPCRCCCSLHWFIGYRIMLTAGVCDVFLPGSAALLVAVLKLVSVAWPSLVRLASYGVFMLKERSFCVPQGRRSKCRLLNQYIMTVTYGPPLETSGKVFVVTRLLL